MGDYARGFDYDALRERVEKAGEPESTESPDPENEQRVEDELG